MKMKIGLALGIALFLVAPVFANSLAPGSVIAITGFDNANATAKFWAGSFTLGTMAGPSLWNVSGFAVNPLNCPACTPSFPAWTLSSFQFDSATSDLLGTAKANFSGLGVSVHLLTLTFVDGNNTSDSWSDLNKFGGLKTGTFSYCLGANCTNPNVPPAPAPEPSTWLLLVSGLMSVVIWRRLTCAGC
jgi:hypothetical protein